jgi:CheY-like chemotaxis protein/predicted regulator of Ras-like GTPase activity (Roadblock/LC7/MglB family)
MSNILVVDPNEAFATLLVEELQRQDHNVLSATSFDEALQVTSGEVLDLALLDMGLEEPGALALAQRLREKVPAVRLMLIPMIGEDISEEVRSDLPIQGVLPKPFFLPELPERIATALTAPLEAPPVGEIIREEDEVAEERLEEPLLEDGEGVSSTRTILTSRSAVQRIMNVLVDELGADVVLLTAGEELLVWVGQLGQEEAESVADAVVRTAEMSSDMAQAFGSSTGGFEQSLVGNGYLLYALSVKGDLTLGVGLRGASRLGLLRLRARDTAAEIANFCK